jgi:hypothetical protein
MEVIIPLLLVCAVAYKGISWYLAVRRMRLYNYQWYKGEFPDLVSDKFVKCYRCGSTNVGTERVMQRTYMRSHFCRSCGTKLYFSPE